MPCKSVYPSCPPAPAEPAAFAWGKMGTHIFQGSQESAVNQSIWQLACSEPFCLKQLHFQDKLHTLLNVAHIF